MDRISKAVVFTLLGAAIAVSDAEAAPVHEPPVVAESSAREIDPRPQGRPLAEPRPKPEPPTGTSPPSHKAANARPPELTSAEVTDSPRPGTVSGVLVGEAEPGGWLWVPRVAFYPLRGALWLTSYPIRAGLKLDENYHVIARIREFFHSEKKSLSFYPTVFVETGFGLNAGARFNWKPEWGILQKVKARVGYGGRYNLVTRGQIVLRGMGPVDEVELTAAYEARPQDRFFGIGNEGAVDSVPGMNVSPLDGTAVSTRFGETLMFGFVRARAPVFKGLNAFLGAAYVRRRYDDAIGETANPSIEQVYDTGELVNFDGGTEYIYTEAELRYDSRRSVSKFESAAIPGAGWYGAMYLGYAKGVNVDDSTDFFRYGADLHRYFRLATGPRNIVVRAHVEGVTGDLDNVPFTELPRLGGPLLLRGYDRDRFRDRVRALGTVEYQWDLGHQLAGFGFVDTGRVFSGLSEMSLSDWNFGFGGGLQLHTKKAFIMRMHVASNTDGQWFFAFGFDPAFDLLNRSERR